MRFVKVRIRLDNSIVRVFSRFEVPEELQRGRKVVLKARVSRRFLNCAAKCGHGIFVQADHAKHDANRIQRKCIFGSKLQRPFGSLSCFWIILKPRETAAKVGVVFCQPVFERNGPLNQLDSVRIPLSGSSYDAEQENRVGMIGPGLENPLATGLRLCKVSPVEMLLGVAVPLPDL